MKLEKVVPFGRCFDEYSKMFNLSNIDLEQNILGVGDGPASFNAEANQRGYKVTSIDPIYEFSGIEIKGRFDEVVDGIIAQVKATPQNWVWSYHKSADDLRNNRVQALNKFLEDYDLGKQEGRYIVEQLPSLCFKNNQFDLALCSHFLFLYSAHYDYSFHLSSILEILRVSREVRIFPLLTLMLETSPFLEQIITELQQRDFVVSCEMVEYELQKGGNKMLRIFAG